MTIKRFEDIEAWQKTRQLTAKIYKITGTGEFARDYGLRDQIRQAAVSSMSNIAEGFERDGNKEFVQFLSMAKGSTGRSAPNSTSRWTPDTSTRLISMTSTSVRKSPRASLPDSCAASDNPNCADERSATDECGQLGTWNLTLGTNV